MGSSSLTGALADFLAGVQGSNLGGGDHAAVLLDSGSAANLVGLTVARNAMAGIDVREEGVAAIPVPLRFHGSDQVHSCHRKAM